MSQAPSAAPVSPFVEDSSHGSHTVHAHTPSAKAVLALSVGALGVVYGDIGTSPLYAIRECFAQQVPTPDAVIGIVSLIFWSLTLVVVLKYLTFVLRADNHGEGGILALLALAEPQGHTARLKKTLLLIGLVGSALLFADGVITPAISVLSAIEGLEVVTPAATNWVVPISIGILIGLFAVQRGGTGTLGAFFGPAVALWFVSIAAIGLPWIARAPQVLHAIDPSYAWQALRRGPGGYAVLGSVVLCVTGGEALYADLGHFGRAPIRWAWYCVVFPSLLVSYFGQGAYLIASHPTAIGNPFYEMAPLNLRLPLVMIATVATVVASQALITGVFAMVHQASQLGYLPRVTIVHTSKQIEGRIYIPQANTALMILCIALLFSFHSSSSLAAAYGIAVTGTMSLTSILFFAALYRKWGVPKTLALSSLFLVVDLAFLGANVHKIASGGWVPLAVATACVAIMTSWQRGVEMVSDRLRVLQVPLARFLERINAGVTRVPGTAVFLTREANGAPPLLVHYVDHCMALQKQVVLLTVRIEHIPRVPDAERFTTSDLGCGFHGVLARYGFMESPDLGQLLAQCEAGGLPISVDESTIFVGHSRIVITGDPTLAPWRKRIFAMLNRNARPYSMHYGLPSSRVMEIGGHIEI